MKVELVHQLSEEQVHRLNALYQNEWWSKGRTLEETRKMLKNTTMIFGLIEPDTNTLVAFARVLSDCTFKTLIMDVIVDSKFRGLGLGNKLMNLIRNHPNLKDSKHFELYCLPHLVPFYKKWEFTDENGDIVFMRSGA